MDIEHLVREDALALHHIAEEFMRKGLDACRIEAATF